MTQEKRKENIKRDSKTGAAQAGGRGSNRKQAPKQVKKRYSRKLPRRVGTREKPGILARTNLTKVQLSIVILGIVLAVILIASFYYMYTIARKSSRALADNNVITQDADKSWMTRVVNQNSPIGTDVTILTSIADPETGAQVDDRATKQAQNLLKAVQEAVPEEKVNILAAYTSAASYQDQYNKALEQLMQQGLSRKEAQAQVQAQGLLPPGTDEHSTGLLVNFGVNNTLDANTVKNSEAGNWLRDNAWRYGFIQRYPEGKEASTSHAADYTAYRYVGEENAQRISTQNLSLEEYNALLAQEAQQAAAEQAAQQQAQQQQAQQQAQQQQAQPAQ